MQSLKMKLFSIHLKFMIKFPWREKDMLSSRCKNIIFLTLDILYPSKGRMCTNSYDVIEQLSNSILQSSSANYLNAEKGSYKK